jgi:hypothetical protein
VGARALLLLPLFVLNATRPRTPTQLSYAQEHVQVQRQLHAATEPLAAGAAGSGRGASR